MKKLFKYVLFSLGIAIAVSSVAMADDYFMGNSLVGASHTTFPDNQQRTTVYSCNQTGTVTGAYIYVSANAADALKVELYACNAANSPTALLASSNTQTATYGWNYFSLPGSVSVTTNAYYGLAFWEIAPGNDSYYFDSGANCYANSAA